MNIRRFAKNN
uniref:Uncharacterized protein n=1 Tax=Rhizophora mucronata TaxID=61149 RepID=A0A2P2PD78_RHIMU